MTETTLALLIFLMPLAYSPGPGNMIFAAMGARAGLAATWPASAGYHLATWAVTLVIGFGFNAALTAQPGVARAVQLIGAAYVLWLAAGLWRAGAIRAGSGAVPVMGFGGGAVLLLFNPKAYVIIVLMFTQFAESPGLGVIGVATVFTFNNMLAFALWAALGARLARLWSRPAQALRLNRVLAAMLGAVALWMALA